MKIINIYMGKYSKIIQSIVKMNKSNNKNNNKNRKIKNIVIFLVIIIVLILLFFLLYNFFYKNNEVEDELLDIDKDITKENVENVDIIKIKYNENKLLALTFDDGPSAYTKLLIDGLKERNVNVTFFILGENIYKHPEYIKEAYLNGNEIEIHAYTHKQFTKLTNEEILQQIDKVNLELLPLIDKKPNLIRVPYGLINNRIKDLLKSIDMQNVLWTVDSKDWKFLNTKKDYEYLIKIIKGNSIILMHDTYKPSVNAALMVIDKLIEDGYMFVTVDEYITCINSK